jgi:hypothetical protein
MLPRFTEREVKELVRKVDELHTKLPTLDDYLLAEVREPRQVESSGARLSTQNH